MQKVPSIIFSITATWLIGMSVLAQTTPVSTTTNDLYFGAELSKEVRDAIEKRILDQQKQILDAKNDFDKKMSEALDKATKDALKTIDIAKNSLITPPELILDSKNMKPGTNMRVSVNTFSLDLGGSNIAWYHNGKSVSSGSGNVSYRFILGVLGTAENIRAVITTSTGKIYEVSKIIRPARIYVTWRAETYTPPWYKGKTLPPPGATIKVIAVPDFRIGQTVLDPRDITYEWTINDAKQPVSSGTNGKGKNIFSFTTGLNANIEHKITVFGKDAAGRIAHEESFKIRAHRPELVFYERDPLLGLKYWQALRDTQVPSGKDTVLQFEPFNLHTEDMRELFYTWKVNGQKITNQNPQSRVLRFSSSAGSSGRQAINVSYENPNRVFMRGSSQIAITVDK